MTRINTNVSSLVAQKTLAQSNASLQQALARLSTGLRINSGKDDPAGLIASEMLRSDIVSTQKGISNSNTANQMIATADSAIGQVSSLLNDIRALVTESANQGALSPDQLVANQLQVDSSLDAINRIAQTTTFQGRRLLDGSLDFVYHNTGGVGDIAQHLVADMQISQANLSNGAMGITAHITTEATQAAVTNDGITTAAVAAFATVDMPTEADLVVTAASTGTEWNDITVTFTQTASIAAGSALATYDAGTKELNVYVNTTGAAVTGITINTAITTAAGGAGLFTTNGAAGVGGLAAGETAGPAVTTASGTDGGLTGKVVFQLMGTRGTQVFSFDAGTTGVQIQDAVNLLSDATGVEASWDAPTHTISFESTDYGSDAYVQVKVLTDETTGYEFSDGFTPTSARDEGTDIVATINGYTATGKGNKMSIYTATLAISITMTTPDALAPLTGLDLKLSIDSGGALFQLGPDVVSNQQIRMGIQSLDTGTLGGVDGRLFQIKTGESYNLEDNPTTAAAIVDEAINKVTTLRGSLGAFQKTQLETNINALSDTVEALTNAESSIRDADFAAETANLTRAQILVQSGTAVLQIANQNPQNVLALLRG
jgi:flagellin